MAMSDDGYIYVTSDIHGNIDRYKRLLELINFNSKDRLTTINTKFRKQVDELIKDEWNGPIVVTRGIS